MDHDSVQPQAGRELEDHLINRALRDDQFRELLIANPRQAVEAEIERLQLGITLPTNLRINVLEERTDTLYLVLPPNLMANAPKDDDFFLEALRAMIPGKNSDEPNGSR